LLSFVFTALSVSLSLFIYMVGRLSQSQRPLSDHLGGGVLALLYCCAGFQPIACIALCVWTVSVWCGPPRLFMAMIHVLQGTALISFVMLSPLAMLRAGIWQDGNTVAPSVAAFTERALALGCVKVLALMLSLFFAHRISHGPPQTDSVVHTGSFASSSIVPHTFGSDENAALSFASPHNDDEIDPPLTVGKQTI
jgi:hypothetical protein